MSAFSRETPASDEAALWSLVLMLPGDGWHIGPRRVTLRAMAHQGWLNVCRAFFPRRGRPRT